MNRAFVPRRRLLASALAFLMSAALPAFAGDGRTLSQEVNGFALTLRLPQTMIVTTMETVLYLRVEEGDGERRPVPYARIEATAKPDGENKTVVFSALPGGVAGEYTLVGNFPAEGAYTLSVKVTPSGEGAKSVQTVFAPLAVTAGKGGKSAEKGAKSDYLLKMETTPSQPLPGESVQLRLSVVDAATKKRVTDFEAIYGARMHVYFVREDAGTLRRETPTYLDAAPGSKDDGVFTMPFSFPTGGAWRVFAEVAPTKQGTQTLTTSITIPGAQALPEPMMAQIAPVVRQSGVTLRFARPTRFVARQTVYLPLLLEDGQGNPLSDLQITDTAIAHLFFVDKPGKNFVHTIPDAGDPQGRIADNQITFPVRFPAGGTYRAFLVGSRGAQPMLVTFVVRVSNK